MNGVKGMVFDIKRFSTADGPGIRTLVFFKGCPLKCRWCSNPESQRTSPEIVYTRKSCVGCGRCVSVCPCGAIRPDPLYGFVTDREKCIFCGECASACYYEARRLVGRETSVSELMGVILRDKNFYDNSSGGITITGGEPLAQPEFLRELLKACKESGIGTAIETSGYAPWKHLEELLPLLDLIFYDFKHIDPKMHKKYTGVSNEQIKENLRRINDTFTGELIVRIPFIPGCNSSDETVRGMISHISGYKAVKRIEIMPYHRLGSAKYAGLDRNYMLKDVEAAKGRDLEYLCEIGREFSISVRIDAE